MVLYPWLRVSGSIISPLILAHTASPKRAPNRMRLPDDIAEVAVFMALQTPETMTGQLVSATEYDEEHGVNRLSAYERLHA